MADVAANSLHGQSIKTRVEAWGGGNEHSADSGLHGQSIKTRVEASKDLGTNWADSRLHGQSIKTRVEARGAGPDRRVCGVYTDNPLKQGLKLAPHVYEARVPLSTRTIH